jgi:glycosyltransferase involved in cell wall biosynthesis
MKIAIDVRDADGQKTGKGFYSFGLVSHILKQDQENQYLLYSDKASNPFPAQENVTFCQIPATGLKWHWETLKDLKKVRPDLYFAPTSFIIPAFAPKWLKTIITVHDLVAFLYPGNHNKKAVFIEKLTLKRALHKASRVLVVSENTLNDLVKQFKVPKSLTYQVPCAPNDLYRQEVDAKEAEEVKKKFKLPEKYILAVGTLEPRKNFINLIKAFVVVKRKYPEYKLIIVGKKGWKHNAIDKAVKQYNIESEVLFPGYMKDSELHCTYQSASVFVFPSLYEGFGIPPLEAMASGCPVVSSNAASLPEVVDDAALMVDPKNSIKIADAIISVFENPQVRSMLIERGFKRSQRYNWEYSARLALELINELKPVQIDRLKTD